MSDLIKREDAIKVLAKILYEEPPYLNSEEKCMAFAEKELSRIPTIEPNLILPERMERGECYEVGETIVVLNHDDYYDLLCKPTVDKDYLIKLIQEAVYDGEACKRLLDLVDRPQGEWINVGTYEECKDCGEIKRFPHWNFCPDCGADCRGGNNEHDK